MSQPVEIKNIAGSILQTNQQSLTSCINTELNKLSVADSVLDACVFSNKVNVNISSTTGTLPVSEASLDACISANKVATTNPTLDACVTSNRVVVDLDSIDATLTSGGGLKTYDVNLVSCISSNKVATSNSVIEGCISSNKLAVDIAGQTQSPLIVKNNAVSATSLYQLGTTSQEISDNATGGVVASVWTGSNGLVTNDIDFIKLYNGTTATYTDTPIAIFPITHTNHSNFIDTKNLTFTNGLCVRASASFTESGGAVAPTGVAFITAFIYENPVVVALLPEVPKP